MLDKNQNNGQKSKFGSKIKNFGQKLKFWKSKFLTKNRNVRQNSNFVKILIIF